MRQVPQRITTRSPAYRGESARRGEVLAELPHSAAFEHYLEGRPYQRCRKPAHWWRDTFFVRELAQRHPERVAALLPIHNGTIAWSRAAQRAGVTVEILRTWHDELTEITRRDLWEQRRALRHCQP